VQPEQTERRVFVADEDRRQQVRPECGIAHVAEYTRRAGMITSRSIRATRPKEQP
jgi:hypothetical protein